MTNDKKSIKQQPTGYRVYSQYILVGAAIGLYYGAFYRGTQTSDYGMAVILAVLAGIITTIARSWKKNKTFKEIAIDFIKITVMFMAFLLALQLKPVMDRMGGRVLVIAFTTLVGMIFGIIVGVQRKPAK